MTAGTQAAPPFRRAAGGAGARIEAVMWMLLAAIGVFAVVAAFDLVYLARVLATLPGPDLGRLAAGENLGVTEMVLLWGLLLVYAVWFVMTGRVVRDLGADPAPVLRTTPMTLWQVGAAVTLVTAFVLPKADLMATGAFGERLRWMVPIVAVRLGLAVVLVAAVSGCGGGCTSSCWRPGWRRCRAATSGR
ncbi:hypothetical protein [Dactylosporangium sp. CA-233914]|uniref:hypothetical protein n=1 Tax=Dactylosporangium sp. CA-233914 TaxID=3239934 RepID=UPI003D8C7D0A